MEPPDATGDRLGIIVGSGLSAAAVAGPEAERRAVPVPGGSVDVLDCGAHVVLPRHGLDGFTPAHRLDHHANLTALAAVGCSRLIGVASVGSLRADWGVGTSLAPDDVLALGCYPTWFDDARGHRVPAFDGPWRARVIEAWTTATTTPLALGGTYAMTTGPRFETPAEVRFLAAHADVVGMTIPAELVLAGEAGIPYASICQVDNLANGLGGEILDVDAYRANVAANADRLVADLRSLATALSGAST
jgi:5'-methylthioadenosine phosphorylase